MSELDCETTSRSPGGDRDRAVSVEWALPTFTPRSDSRPAVGGQSSADAGQEEFLCARCARHQRTCCQGTDIVVTAGDVGRIAGHVGRDDFTEYRGPANANYADQDDDPIWRDNVVRPDGTRRVVQQRPNGDCAFLGPVGCTLPLNVRPLICRLYPFDYTADGVKAEPASGCPVELLRSGQQLLQVLDMHRADADRWHRQLYDEILQEAGVQEQAAFTTEAQRHGELVAKATVAWAVGLRDPN